MVHLVIIIEAMNKDGKIFFMEFSTVDMVVHSDPDRLVLKRLEKEGIALVKLDI